MQINFDLYDTQGLNSLERSAYISGDKTTAELAAIAADAAERIAEFEDAQYKLERIEAIITECNWRTGKKSELREMGDRIYQELKGEA